MCLFPQAMQNECSWLFPTLSGCLRNTATQELVSASLMDGFGPRSLYWWASLVAQMIKNLPTMQETQVWFLGKEDSLEKGMATHSSILAWRIPQTEEPDRLQSMGSQRVRHDLVTKQHGVSSSHVWMWDLDHKEGWAPKNWCFQTVVLEKTLESPLDSKEIKPVNPKGNQAWIFIGRTDAKVEVPIFWPPDEKNWLIRKDSDPEKDLG